MAALVVVDEKLITHSIIKIHRNIINVVEVKFTK